MASKKSVMRVNLISVSIRLGLNGRARELNSTADLSRIRTQIQLGRWFLRSISRDLLQLEHTTPPISPFIIQSPTQGTNTQSGASTANFPFPPPGLLNRPNPTTFSSSSSTSNKLKTFPVPPPSDLLARVAAFLPQLAKANAQLEQDIARVGSERFNIEHVEDEAAPHIEMNLDVGVLELQKADDPNAEPSIIIPGISSPSSLSANSAAAAAANSTVAAMIAAAAAESSSNDDSDDSDDEPSSSTHTNPHSLRPQIPSRAARKKQKYRVRAKDKQQQQQPQPHSTSEPMQADEPEPLPKCQNPLIQEMEE